MNPSKPPFVPQQGITTHPLPTQQWQTRAGRPRPSGDTPLDPSLDNTRIQNISFNDRNKGLLNDIFSILRIGSWNDYFAANGTKTLREVKEELIRKISTDRDRDELFAKLNRVFTRNTGSTPAAAPSANPNAIENLTFTDNQINTLNQILSALKLGNWATYSKTNKSKTSEHIARELRDRTESMDGIDQDEVFRKIRQVFGVAKKPSTLNTAPARDTDIDNRVGQDIKFRNLKTLLRTPGALDQKSREGFNAMELRNLEAANMRAQELAAKNLAENRAGAAARQILEAKLAEETADRKIYHEFLAKNLIKYIYPKYEKMWGNLGALTDFDFSKAEKTIEDLGQVFELSHAMDLGRESLSAEEDDDYKEAVAYLKELFNLLSDNLEEMSNELKATKNILTTLKIKISVGEDREKILQEFNETKAKYFDIKTKRSSDQSLFDEINTLIIEINGLLKTGPNTRDATQNTDSGASGAPQAAPGATEADTEPNVSQEENKDKWTRELEEKLSESKRPGDLRPFLAALRNDFDDADKTLDGKIENKDKYLKEVEKVKKKINLLFEKAQGLNFEEEVQDDQNQGNTQGKKKKNKNEGKKKEFTASKNALIADIQKLRSELIADEKIISGAKEKKDISKQAQKASDFIKQAKEFWNIKAGKDPLQMTENQKEIVFFAEATEHFLEHFDEDEHPDMAELASRIIHGEDLIANIKREIKKLEKKSAEDYRKDENKTVYDEFILAFTSQITHLSKQLKELREARGDQVEGHDDHREHPSHAEKEIKKFIKHGRLDVAKLNEYLAKVLNGSQDITIDDKVDHGIKTGPVGKAHQKEDLKRRFEAGGIKSEISDLEKAIEKLRDVYRIEGNGELARDLQQSLLYLITEKRTAQGKNYFNTTEKVKDRYKEWIPFMDANDASYERNFRWTNRIKQKWGPYVAILLLAIAGNAGYNKLKDTSPGQQPPAATAQAPGQANPAAIPAVAPASEEDTVNKTTSGPVGAIPEAAPTEIDQLPATESRIADVGILEGTKLGVIYKSVYKKYEDDPDFTYALGYKGRDYITTRGGGLVVFAKVTDGNYKGAMYVNFSRPGDIKDKEGHIRVQGDEDGILDRNNYFAFKDTVDPSKYYIVIKNPSDHDAVYDEVRKEARFKNNELVEYLGNNPTEDSSGFTKIKDAEVQTEIKNELDGALDQQAKLRVNSKVTQFMSQDTYDTNFKNMTVEDLGGDCVTNEEVSDKAKQSICDFVIKTVIPELATRGSLPPGLVYDSSYTAPNGTIGRFADNNTDEDKIKTDFLLRRYYAAAIDRAQSR